MNNRQLRFIQAIIIGISAAVLYSTIREFHYQLSHLHGFALPNGKPLGGDFACFYLAGKLLQTNPGALYQFEEHLRIQQAFFSGSGIEVGFLPFIYPPLVAWCFSLLAELPFVAAAFLWLALSCLAGVTAILMVISQVPGDRIAKVTLAMAALAYVPFSIDCLAGGQTAAIGLLIFAAVFSLLRAQHHFIAGCVFALSYYKPPLFVVYLIFAVLSRNRRFLSGFFICGSVLVLASFCVVGVSGMESYVYRALGYQHGSEMLPGYVHPPGMGAGAYSSLLLLLPRPLALGAFILVIIVLTYQTATLPKPASAADKDLRFALQSGLSVFASIWLMIYDYTLLLPSLLIVAAYLGELRSRWLRNGLIVVSALLFFEYLFRDFPEKYTMIKVAPLLLFLWIVLLKEAVRHNASSHGA